MSSWSWLLQRFLRANSRRPTTASWRSSAGRFGRRCASRAGSHRRNLAKKKRMQRGEPTTIPPLAGRRSRRRRGPGCRGRCHECKRRILRGADSGLSHDGLHCELQLRTGNRSRSISACGAESAGEFPTWTTYPLPSHTHCARSNSRGLVRRETSRPRSSGDFRKPQHCAVSRVRVANAISQSDGATNGDQGHVDVPAPRGRRDRRS